MFRYRESDLVRLDILINSEPVDPLAAIVHKDKVYMNVVIGMQDSFSIYTFENVYIWVLIAKFKSIISPYLNNI